MEYLYEALKRAGDRTLHAFPSALPLVLHSSISYLGFFVNDSPADIIREFAVMFATEASILAGRQPWAVVRTEPWFTEGSPFAPGAGFTTLGCWVEPRAAGVRLFPSAVMVSLRASLMAGHGGVCTITRPLPPDLALYGQQL